MLCHVMGLTNAPFDFCVSAAQFMFQGLDRQALSWFWVGRLSRSAHDCY